MRTAGGELLSVGIVGSVGMLETNSFQSFQHFNAFNDFNALQEGNAVQDSPLSCPWNIVHNRHVIAFPSAPSGLSPCGYVLQGGVYSDTLASSKMLLLHMHGL